MSILNPNWHTLRERTRRWFVAFHLQVVQWVWRERPVPLDYWLVYRSILRSVFRSPDCLSPEDFLAQISGMTLAVPELRELLRNDLLGRWSLGASTITFLWKRMQQECPNIMVECGSGLSTLVLTKNAARRALEKTRPSVYSLEQDLGIKDAIEKRLEACGLGNRAEILYTPISDLGNYEFDPEKLRERLGSNAIDWLLIDGPAGPDGCRVSTLPFLAKFCRPGARWYLDDAFRDGELQTLNDWGCLPGINVEGIYPIGKGLATGTVNDPSQVPTPPISYRF